MEACIKVFPKNPNTKWSLVAQYAKTSLSSAQKAMAEILALVHGKLVFKPSKHGLLLVVKALCVISPQQINALCMHVHHRHREDKSTRRKYKQKRMRQKQGLRGGVTSNKK